MSSEKWKNENAELMRGYRTSWYQRNADAEKAKASERNKLYRERNVQIAREAKDKPCTDCKVSYPYYVMHFDHLGDDKDKDIKTMAWRPVSEARLRAEIAKCEPVCANCHAERTHQRRMAQQLDNEMGM